ncbi:MAG: amidase [Kiloniellales bacterium]
MNERGLSAPALGDPLGAFVPGPRPRIEGKLGGPLSGFSFAAKDIFDIAGFVTGCGNPDWARTHEAAARHAAAVDKLLAAGATFIGKTITDELAYSLNGRNFHYGTPANANAPGRIPGGSSSGSASAVAGGLVDVALGSDTGGSVRVPASYCGLFGYRPSHGRVDISGVMPLAPSFDTVGWFARDAALLGRVGAVLLPPDEAGAPKPRRLLVAEDLFALASSVTRSALAPAIARLEMRLGKAEPVRLAAPEETRTWMLRFRAIQAREIWASHGDWIARTEPHFGPEIAERFAWVQTVTDREAAAARAARAPFAERLRALAAEGALIALPSAPDAAPLIEASDESLRGHRERVLSLTAPAGLSGLPQIAMPLARVAGGPVGLSLIGNYGSDRALLAFAAAFCRERDGA